jgi:hypothetical protein
MTGIVQWLRLAISKGPSWAGVFSLLHLRTETDPVSEMSCFQFCRIPDDGKSPETQWFCNSIITCITTLIFNNSLWVCQIMNLRDSMLYVWIHTHLYTFLIGFCLSHTWCRPDPQSSFGYSKIFKLPKNLNIHTSNTRGPDFESRCGDWLSLVSSRDFPQSLQKKKMLR